MEEKSGFERCKTWEEEMYWKHFNSMHFCRILPKNFHDHLVLPEKFGAHMATQLSDKVSLTGPNGTVFYIELQKKDNLLLVGDGWKGFVKAYELEENCLLMFKYNRNSSFDVLIFDRDSFCEKEAAYFKKGRHSESEHENHKKRIVREGSSPEVIEDDKNDDFAFVASKKSKNDVEEEVVCLGQEDNSQNPRNHTFNGAPSRRGRPRKKVVPCSSLSNPTAQSMEKDPSGNEFSPELISRRDQSTPEDSSEMNHSHRLRSLYGKEPSEDVTAEVLNQISSIVTLDNRYSSPEADHSDKPRIKRGRPKKLPVSRSSEKHAGQSVSAGKSNSDKYVLDRKREVTDMEKENALRRAKQERTENSFIVVMRPTCVYRRFYLSIPVDWMNTHLTLQHQEIVLRMDDKTWLTMFYYNQKRGVGGICPGWKKFAHENSLEEFDVLLFKLANHKDDGKIVFDVEIFRVIPKILPPPLPSSPMLT